VNRWLGAALLLAAAGCSPQLADRREVQGSPVRNASVDDVPVHGAQVRVERRSSASNVSGELLAVEPDRLLVLSDQDCALQARQARAERARSRRADRSGMSDDTPGRSGTRIPECAEQRPAVAEVPLQDVSEVEVDVGPSGLPFFAIGAVSTLTHGVFFIFSLPLWIGVGVVAGQQSEQYAPAEGLALLRQYARYPQGMPR